jgi:hypothetical protein
MSDSASFPSARRVNLPDHLWEALETMAREMGGDRDGLVAQAIFTFARLNGYVVPGQVNARAARSEPARSDEGPRTPLPPVPRAEARTTMSIGRLRSAVEPERSPGAAAEAEPPRRGVADRVLETAAQLEKLVRDRPASSAAPAVAVEPAPLEGEELGLFLAAEDGKLDPVAKDRFLIGRGKHCDLVINSGKVSREHAAIVHEGDGWFIEDLGSSNGTWFNKQRIKRRKIEDGDEYFVCSEKLRCVFRAAS